MSSTPPRRPRIAKARRKFYIVASQFNAQFVQGLADHARQELRALAPDATISLHRVPGAFEIPFGIKSYWDANKYKDDRPHAFIALGCVLRGDTPHFEYVCRGVTEGITQLNLSLPVPVIFGILTVDNDQQAQERIGGKHGHKGEEAAITALKMISLAHSFKNHS